MRTDMMPKGAIGVLALGLALPAGPAYAEDFDLRAAVHL